MSHTLIIINLCYMCGKIKCAGLHYVGNFSGKVLDSEPIQSEDFEELLRHSVAIA